MKKEAFREEVVAALVRHSGLTVDEVEVQLTVPPKPELGDFAFPCFVLAKKLRAPPPAIAADLAARAAAGLTLVEKAAPSGPYVNFTLNRPLYAEAVLREAIAEGAAYGTSNEGQGKVVAIDYSSPNIAKPFHVGHLRSTIIGSALYRLFGALGYKPVGINHLGDWGTQFGKQIVGLKRWGSPADLNDLMALNRLYVKYHAEERNIPELAGESREWFRRQEAGDKEALEYWRAIRDTSLEYFKRIYDRLGVKFDAYTGESFFNDKMEPIIERAKSMGLTSVSEGALVIDLSSQGLETALLRKTDGATLYMTRDIAAAEYRHETYRFHKLLYVVGTAQSLHFQQLFAVLKLLGHPWASDCVHVAFGLVQGMSTRQGNVIYLEELLDEAKTRTLAHMREHIEKRSGLEDDDAVAEAVGIAAIFFSDLSKTRIRDYSFDWDRAISFEGDTGPYLMNAHARIAGIVRKCGIDLDPAADLSPLVEPEAHQLVSLAGRYQTVLREAARHHEPSVLAGYLLDLAHALHASYRSLRVKDEEPRTARARLLLFTVVKDILASGLRILGIAPLERM
ncbi:MAG TPA: arginine--tRNA ligase [Planctomycetota bacterium]|nr:arginine--tRNA ligase [Planctomycetota bacterium]